MMGALLILAKRSEVKNPRRFARIARTLKIRYFSHFYGQGKQLEIGVLRTKFDASKS